jgi:hypothetical protein
MECLQNSIEENEKMKGKLDSMETQLIKSKGQVAALMNEINSIEKEQLDII